MKFMQKQTLEKIARVIDALKELPDGANANQIARMSELHPTTVTRIVDLYLNRWTTVTEVPLGKMTLRMIRLCKDINVDDVKRYIDTKRRIKGVN